MPLLPDGARERAGRRELLRALRHARRKKEPDAVVLQDHRVCGRALERAGYPRLAGKDQGDAAQLDRPLDGLRDRVCVRDGRQDPRVHDALRHRVRRHLRRARSRASSGAQARNARTDAGRRGIHRLCGTGERDRPPFDDARKDGRVYGFVCHQPHERQEGTHLPCRLCAGFLRHGRGDGRSRPRRERLCLRDEVLPAHRQGHRKPQRRDRAPLHRGRHHGGLPRV